MCLETTAGRFKNDPFFLVFICLHNHLPLSVVWTQWKYGNFSSEIRVTKYSHSPQWICLWGKFLHLVSLEGGPGDKKLLFQANNYPETETASSGCMNLEAAPRPFPCWNEILQLCNFSDPLSLKTQLNCSKYLPIEIVVQYMIFKLVKFWDNCLYRNRLLILMLLFVQF